MENLALYDVPLPQKNATFDMLSMDCQKCGFLKIKEKGIISPKWNRRYVILKNGCIYLFKNDRNQNCEKSFSLFGYNEISKAPEAEDQIGFKICYALGSKAQMKYFSATDITERKDWMIAIRQEMMKAHKIGKEIDADSSVDVTEVPISTKDFFDDFRNTYDGGIDSDLDSEYSYIPSDSNNHKDSRSNHQDSKRNHNDSKSHHNGSKSGSSSNKIPQAPPPFTIFDNLPHAQNRNSVKPKIPPKPRSEKPDFEKESRWTGPPEEGLRFLVKLGSEGSYMVRSSADGLDALLVISRYQPRKYKICEENNKVFLDKSSGTFASLNSLIIHYRSHPVPKTDTRLKDPLSSLMKKQ